jgi:Berberine and berberine like
MIQPRGLAALHMDPPEPSPGAGDGMLLSDLPADAIDALVGVTGPGTNTTLVSLEIRQLGGAVRRSDPEHGVRDAIEASYALFAVGIVMNDEMKRAAVQRHDQLHAALAPWDAGNLLNFADRPADPAGMFTDEAYRRLREVKSKYDPDDVIHANHEIPPAG